MVTSYSGYLEGGLLAWQISNCLEATNCLKADREFSSIAPLGGFFVGVFFSGKNEKLSSKIRTLLTEKGIFVGEGSGFLPGNMHVGPLPSGPNTPDDVTVHVAARPLPETLHK
jgi:hypothetical protein